jgi:hypothetical protein
MNPLQIDITIIASFTGEIESSMDILRSIVVQGEPHNNSDIDLQRIPATEQAADVLTKILPQDQARRSLTIVQFVFLYHSSLTNSTSRFSIGSSGSSPGS